MKIEVFYDYECPFCLRGYNMLKEVFAEFEDLEIEWKPVESHPRPERYWPYSDLCAMGMYIARDMGVDTVKYSDRIYEAVVRKEIDIQKPEEIADLLQGLVEKEGFVEALKAGKYREQLEKNNVEVWETLGFDAVPSLKIGDKTLGAIPGVGLTRGRVIDFIKENI
ncbi:MAG: DsbA family protein [Suipraeoptans sp.]